MLSMQGGQASIPAWGTKILHTIGWAKKKKKKGNRASYIFSKT